jgi:hypothetical protein
MLADGTDEIIGEILSHIFVSADPASPDGLTLGGSSYSLGLRLDIALIVFISTGG